MRKKHRILFATLVVALLGAIAWVALRRNEPEPIYQGKSLSEWLAIYDPTNTVRSPEDLQATQAAIREMGTNAIPVLLRMMRTQDPRWKEWLINLARRQSVVPVRHVSSASLHERAALGLTVLGHQADSAIPDLIQIYDQNLSPDSQASVVRVLALLGPSARAAVPSLIRGATNTNEVVRANVIYALGKIHADPDLVVPVLIKSLQDDSPLIRAQAATALGDFGPAAKAAVPALVELRKNPGTNASASPWTSLYNVNISKSVDDALRKIDPDFRVEFVTNNPASPR